MATQTERSPLNPVPGHYLVRLVPGAWQVPALIEEIEKSSAENQFSLASTTVFIVTIDGGCPEGWTREWIEEAVFDWLRAEKASDTARLLMFGELTDEATYNQRLAYKEWARENSPDHPCLHSRKPMDPRLLPAEDF